MKDIIIIKKEWIGKRKIRIYLLWRGRYHSFCWIKLLTDASFSFGFEPKELQKMREYGSVVTRSGDFVEHTQTLRSGNIDIENVRESHLTFHPPRIRQKKGIVQIKANDNKIVDKFELGWFPVNRIQTPLYIYTGDISKLEKANNPKGRYEIVNIPYNVQFVRMEFTLYPITKKPVDDPHALANILGFCPHYIVSCRFYQDNLAEAGYCIASDY